MPAQQKAGAIMCNTDKTNLTIMLYLFWALLNIGLFLSFIVICFRATKLIRERVGLFASIIFVFGLLSFVGNSNDDNKEPNSNQIKTWNFASEVTLNKYPTYVINMDIDKTLISNYDLSIKYGKDKQGQLNIPICANSWTTGFVSGTNWKPIAIAVNRTDDNNRFKYFVAGVVEWKLLGATIYSQPKEYKGIALTK